MVDASEKNALLRALVIALGYFSNTDRAKLRFFYGC